MDQTKTSGLFCLGMHETDGDGESYGAECPKMDEDAFHETTKSDVIANSGMYTDHSNTSACLDEYNIPGIQPLDEIRFGSRQHFELQPGKGMVGDTEEESMPSSPESSSTTNYDMPGYMEQNLQHMQNAFDAMVDKEGPLVFAPDFIMFDKTLHLKPCLTFSSDGIKIEYLHFNSCEDDEMTALFWEISNIISISCKWAEAVGSAFITLLVEPEAEIENSGPVKVQFCLDDPQWPMKQHHIWYLGARYEEIWKDIPSDDFAPDDWIIEPNLFFPKQYFLSTDNFEDIIYPKGDPDAVSISKRDAELLLPETFVNDTIIDFYIKYLSTRIESSEKRRYHFFNSFFFRKLADLDKDQGRAPEGRAAFLRVRKWTRKINIFEKDFLFIPVNFNLHWSLIVICYPGEVATCGDGEKNLPAKVPCILHMDSLKGSHVGLKDIIQSYLWEEWKERHPKSSLNNSGEFLNLRFASLELPQQDNSFDCGLFLLHYVELFLMDVPSDFNPLKIDVFSDFLNGDWFPPAEASLKRSVIQKLINELVAGSCQNDPKLVCANGQLDERHQRSRDAEQESAGELIDQRCSTVEPELVCTILDSTHGRQPSTSISLNDSKGLPASECKLDTRSFSMDAVHNPQESTVCVPDKDTFVSLSSQDEKIELLIAGSNNQVNMTSCAPDDAEVLEGSCLATDSKHVESLHGSFNDSPKISNQLEVEAQDIMISTCCPLPENAEDACQEHSLQRNTAETGDDCCGPSQDMDSMMILDSRHDDVEKNLVRPTGEGDGRDICEDMKHDTNLVRPTGEGDGHDICEDMKHKDDLAESTTTENATNRCVKEIGVHEDPSELCSPSDLPEGNTDGVMADAMSKVAASDNGKTGDSTVCSQLNDRNTDQLDAGDSTKETDTTADNDDASKNIASDVTAACDGVITCTNVEVPCSEKNETISENTASGAEVAHSNVIEDRNEVVSADIAFQKDDTQFADTKRPQPDGINQEEDKVVLGDKHIQKDDADSSDAKRPPPDSNCEEKDAALSGEKRIQRDDAHGTEVKQERHYKRRKVLAADLERQRSSKSFD